MNLALIGPGAMGHEHAKAFTKLDGVVPYLVAGPAQARPAEFGLRHGFLGWTREAKAARETLATIGRHLRERLHA